MPALWGLLLLLLAPLYAQSDTSLTRVDFTELKPAGDTALSQNQASVATPAYSASSTARLDTSIQVHTVKPLAPKDFSNTLNATSNQSSLERDQRQALDSKWIRSVFLYWLGLGATGSGMALQGTSLFQDEKKTSIVLGSTLFLLGTPLMGAGNHGLRQVQKARDTEVPGTPGWTWYGLSWLGVLGGGLMVLDGSDSEDGDDMEVGLGVFCIGAGIVSHYVSAMAFAWDGFHAQIQGPHFRVSPVVRMASQGALAPGLEMAMNW